MPNGLYVLRCVRDDPQMWSRDEDQVHVRRGARSAAWRHERRRTVSTTATTDYVLDNSMMVREMREVNGTPTTYATYLVGPRGPEYRRDANVENPDVRWYAYDGLGSVLAEVTPTGNMTASRTYDVYGLARSSNGTSTSKHKFVGSLGHTSEDDTGLVYMRARWVDPAVGRFVSEDPVRDGANWFSYCSANPVNRTDRSGKEDDWDQETWRVWQSDLRSLGLNLIAAGIFGLSLAAGCLMFSYAGSPAGALAVVEMAAAVGATLGFVAGVYLVQASNYMSLVECRDDYEFFREFIGAYVGMGAHVFWGSYGF